MSLDKEALENAMEFLPDETMVSPAFDTTAPPPPLKTAQERQFSKTGLPQYAEQERDWKATIRVYKNSKEPAEIFFIFQVRNAGSQPTRAEFKLRSEALDGKR